MIYHYHRKEIVSGGGGVDKGKFFEQHYFLRLQKPFPEKCGAHIPSPPPLGSYGTVYCGYNVGSLVRVWSRVAFLIVIRHKTCSSLITRYKPTHYFLQSTRYFLQSTCCFLQSIHCYSFTAYSLYVYSLLTY